MVGCDVCSRSNVIDDNTGRRKLKNYFVQRHISSAFESLGTSVGSHPLLYIVIPLLIAAALSARIYWARLTKATEYLYTPINGRSLRERDAIESIFPSTTNGFDVITLMEFRTMAIILLEPKDGGNILRKGIMREAYRIDKIIQNVTTAVENKTYTYTDLCFKQHLGKCQSNDVLNLLGKTEDIKKRQLCIQYPAHMEVFSQHVTFYGSVLGGVTTNENDCITSAKAMRLFYLLNHTTVEKETAGLKWEESLQVVLSKLVSSNLKISFFVSTSIDNEMNRITEMTFPLITITSVIMVSFAAFSCLTTKWVTSKVLVALAGCISSMLGIVVSFGLLLLCGAEYVDLNITILFLLIGIGLDDSFVIVAAWRRTDSKEDVVRRMCQTYKDAGVSITITSITNILSLCAGLTIPYRIVRIYCAYAATSMFSAYVYQVTFFGGVLALDGYREKLNIHPLLCVTIKKKYKHSSPLLKLLCFGCKRSKEKCANTRDDSRSTVAEKFLTALTTVWGKSVTMTFFLLYLATSGYCLKFLKEGFDYRDAMPTHSYLMSYMDSYYKYFTRYPNSIHVVINETLDYSDNQVQKDIGDMINNFCNGPDMAGNKFALSWLKYYLQSTRASLMQLSYRGYNISQPSDFIAGLRDVFLKIPYGRLFRRHIRFNHNETEIIASRFIIFSKDINSSKKEKRLISTLWNKVDSSKYSTFVHNTWFPFYNMLLDVTSSSIETMCFAAAIVTAVFAIFIPHFLCIIGIMITIASIQVGVVGYMSLWGVPFDPVSMISIILSIGLSVDYAAHISYSYLSCEEESPNEKTKTALRHAGYPIIQGCVSTLLGVVVLAYGPSNLFLVFFKVVTLVMLIAMFHGLFIIPIMLNILETTWRKIHNQCRRRLRVHSASYDKNYVRKENLLSNTEDN